MADSPVLKLRDFFSHKSTRGAISFPEFTQFYKACSKEEQDRMKTEVSSWDGKSEFIPLDVAPATDSSAVTVAA